MQNILLFVTAYMFMFFYRDAIRDTRICYSKFAICDQELKNTKLYLELHNIILD